MIDAPRCALAALDMDGTLLNSAHETTPYTRRVLQRAAEAGGVIALCTGRCLSELRDHLLSLPGVGYAICENGGCVYDVRRNAVVYRMTIPREDWEHVLISAEDLDVCRQCFIDNQSYMQCGDLEALRRYRIFDYAPVFQAGSIFVADAAALCRERGSVEKINLYFSSERDRDEFARRIQGRRLQVAASLGLGYEISPPEATKGRGLEALCHYLNLPVARAMAVGDGDNDVDLMRAAGLAVAMGNACDAVRALADVVTEDCDHDGAARAVARYMGLEDDLR